MSGASALVVVVQELDEALEISRVCLEGVRRDVALFLEVRQVVANLRREGGDSNRSISLLSSPSFLLTHPQTPTPATSSFHFSISASARSASISRFRFLSFTA